MASEISSKYRRVIHGPPPHLPRKKKAHSVWKRLSYRLKKPKSVKHLTQQSPTLSATPNTTLGAPAIWTHPSPSQTYRLSSLSPRQLLSQITQNLHTISSSRTLSLEFHASWALLLTTYYASLSTPGLTRTNLAHHEENCERALLQGQFALLEELLCPGSLSSAGAHCVLKFLPYSSTSNSNSSNLFTTWETRESTSYDWKALSSESNFGVTIVIPAMDPELAAYYSTDIDSNGAYHKNAQIVPQLVREVVKAYITLFLRLPWGKEESEEWYGPFSHTWVSEIFKVVREGVGRILGREIFMGDVRVWERWLLGGGHEGRLLGAGKARKGLCREKRLGILMWREDVAQAMPSKGKGKEINVRESLVALRGSVAELETIKEHVGE